MNFFQLPWWSYTLTHSMIKNLVEHHLYYIYALHKLQLIWIWANCFYIQQNLHANVRDFELWARICRPFKEPRNRFPAWRAGTQLYLSYWPAGLLRLAKSIPRNRFLGSIIVYKYGLWRPEPKLAWKSINLKPTQRHPAHAYCLLFVWAILYRPSFSFQSQCHICFCYHLLIKLRRCIVVVQRTNCIDAQHTDKMNK